MLPKSVASFGVAPKDLQLPARSGRFWNHDDNRPVFLVSFQWLGPRFSYTMNTKADAAPRGAAGNPRILKEAINDYCSDYELHGALLRRFRNRPELGKPGPHHH